MMMVKIKKNCCLRFLEKYVLFDNFVVKIKNRFVDVIYLILYNIFCYFIYLYYLLF